MTTLNRRSAAAALALLAGLGPVASIGQERGSADVPMSPGRAFSQRGGAALYAQVCAACHMPDGRGATGAGTYPKLAENPNLEAAGYPLTVVMLGLRGMPAVGRMMSDEQVAEVVNYLRTHFGNAYPDPIAAADVAMLRPAPKGTK